MKWWESIRRLSGPWLMVAFVALVPALVAFYVGTLFQTPSIRAAYLAGLSTADQRYAAGFAAGKAEWTPSGARYIKFEDDAAFKACSKWRWYVVSLKANPDKQEAEFAPFVVNAQSRVQIDRRKLSPNFGWLYWGSKRTKS